MEALKLLTDMVKDLPDMALWVILAFFFYKVFIVGSIYGVLKLGIIKIHDAVVAKKTAVPEIVEKEIRGTLDGMCITGETNRLIAQIERVKGVRSTAGRTYIHDRDIDWLREAIDEKLESERD